MFKHIVIPTDGSELSIAAVKAGVEFARTSGAKVTFVTVVLPFPDTPLAPLLPEARAAYEAGARDLAAERLAKATEIARDAGVACVTVTAKDSQPFQAIIDAARDSAADAIFMASHGRRGLSGLLLGSETQKVLTHSKLPVVVYR